MLKAEEIIAGIKRLHPEAEFVFNDNDYSTIRWDVLDGTAPTLKQIEAAWNQVIAEQEAGKLAKQTASSSAVAKLEAIGLTAEEIAALRG